MKGVCGRARLAELGSCPRAFPLLWDSQDAWPCSDAAPRTLRPPGLAHAGLTRQAPLSCGDAHTLSSCSWRQEPRTVPDTPLSLTLASAREPLPEEDTCLRLWVPVLCGTSRSVCSLPRGRFPRHLARAGFQSAPNRPLPNRWLQAPVYKAGLCLYLSSLPPLPPHCCFLLPPCLPQTPKH